MFSRSLPCTCDDVHRFGVHSDLGGFREFCNHSRREAVDPCKELVDGGGYNTGDKVDKADGAVGNEN